MIYAVHREFPRARRPQERRLPCRIRADAIFSARASRWKHAVRRRRV